MYLRRPPKRDLDDLPTLEQAHALVEESQRRWVTSPKALKGLGWKG